MDRMEIMRGKQVRLQAEIDGMRREQRELANDLRKAASVLEQAAEVAERIKDIADELDVAGG